MGNYFGPKALDTLSKLIKAELSGKQDKIKGKPNEILGFDENGKLTSVDALNQINDFLKDI